MFAHGGERVGVGDDVGAQGPELVTLPQQHLAGVTAGGERGRVGDIGDILGPGEQRRLLYCPQADLTRNVTPAKLSQRGLLF